MKENGMAGGLAVLFHHLQLIFGELSLNVLNLAWKNGHLVAVP
jgi:hypothetical protein